MKQRTVYIYGLRDPRDGRLRYIGKTINPTYRLWRHQQDYDRGKITHCSTWVKGIVNDGLKPLMEILEETTEADWKETERAWIARGKEMGLDLVNMSDGGTGGGVRGRSMPEEQKAKISAKLKGRVSPAKGKPLREDLKAKLLAGRAKIKPMLGKKLTPEHKAKIGRANAKALKGRKVSEEERLRLQEVANDRWQRDSEREQQAERANHRQRDEHGRFIRAGSDGNH